MGQPDVTYKRDKVTGTLEIRGDLQNPTDFDLYVVYAPRSDENGTCIDQNQKCLNHECMSDEPAYAIVFQLDKEPELTTTCSNGMILCLHGHPRLEMDAERYWVKRANWTSACGDAKRYPRAIRVSANASHWTVETGHVLGKRDGKTSDVAAGVIHVRKSADGMYVMANKMINKIENKQAVDYGEFDRFYKKYVFDSYPECVSKADGMIKAHHMRVIGSNDCHMIATFLGELAPYSVRGINCEVDWEELYPCNNGGGFEDRTCIVTLETGVRDEDERTNTTHSDTDDVDYHEGEITIRKNNEHSFNWKNEIKGEVNLMAGADYSFIPGAGKGLKGALKNAKWGQKPGEPAEGEAKVEPGKVGAELEGQLEGGIEWDNTNTEINELQQIFKNTLRTTDKLTAFEIDIAQKASFEDTTTTYQIITPRGYYQSIVTLKMTCGGLTFYPGFVDVQSRQAGSDKVLHHYSVAGAAAGNNATNRAANLEQETGGEGADTDVYRTDPSGNVAAYDKKITSDLGDLTNALLGWWDGSHKTAGSGADAGNLTELEGLPLANLVGR